MHKTRSATISSHTINLSKTQRTQLNGKQGKTPLTYLQRRSQLVSRRILIRPQIQYAMIWVEGIRKTAGFTGTIKPHSPTDSTNGRIAIFSFILAILELQSLHKTTQTLPIHSEPRVQVLLSLSGNKERQRMFSCLEGPSLGGSRRNHIVNQESSSMLINQQLYANIMVLTATC